MPAETPARVALPLLARLKLTLLRRYFERNALGGIGALAAVIVFTLMLTFAAAGVALYAHAGGAEARDRAFVWSAWVLSLLWLNAPLSQFDTQRSLDLSALRLLPLSAGTFTRAALLDALLSPQGAIVALPTLVLIGALTLNLAELPLVVLSIALLLAANVAFGQALFLAVSRLISSRRFADISIVLGMVLIFAFQGINLLLHTSARESGVPPWLSALAQSAAEIFGPVLAWLYPSLAAGVVSATADGEPLLAAGRATALLAQCGLGLWLAGRATRAFYEGELESGGKARRGLRRRGEAKLRPQQLASSTTGEARFARFAPTGVVAALYVRERLYLWRDPLLKSLFLQSVLSVAYFSMVAVFILLRGAEQPLVQPRYLLLGVALLLTFSESYLLFNKLGLEGQELTATLLSPVSRVKILRAKSIFFMSHFLALNVLVIVALGLALNVAALYIATAVLMLGANAAVADVGGHFVSVWLPHAYRRQGRQFRPAYPQTGCGYMLVYALATQGASLATLPASAALALGALLGGWPGLALGGGLAAGVAWAAYFFGLPLAARQLQQREPELIAAVTRRE